MGSGADLPSFSVQLVDAAGIDTFPTKRETVKVTLEVDTTGKDGKKLKLWEKDARITEVADATGKATFPSIKISANKFTLEASQRDEGAVKVNVKFSGDMGSAEAKNPPKDPACAWMLATQWRH